MVVLLIILGGWSLILLLAVLRGEHLVRVRQRYWSQIWATWGMSMQEELLQVLSHEASQEISKEINSSILADLGG